MEEARGSAPTWTISRSQKLEPRRMSRTPCSGRTEGRRKVSGKLARSSRPQRLSSWQSARKPRR
eukprot:14313625-Heterocapsa_arctica.AAC.1